MACAVDVTDEFAAAAAVDEGVDVTLLTTVLAVCNRVLRNSSGLNTHRILLESPPAK
jgi:hypothetical protein